MARRFSFARRVAGVPGLLAAALLLASCSADEPIAPLPGTAGWRGVATEDDRERVRRWRDAWVEALAQARAAGHGDKIAKEGVLLNPDAALAGAAAPEGRYRCRTIKIGGKSEGMLDYVAYTSFACRIDPDGTLMKLTGSQRPVGRLYPDAPNRMVFLGTLQLGDEQRVLPYGVDRERDVAGLLERIGPKRWRLVFPYPHFESKLDVLELVPAK